MTVPFLKFDLHRAARVPECSRRRAEVQPDVLVPYVLLQEPRHLRVQRRQQLRHHLDQVDRQPALAQALRHFHADVAAPDHDRPSRPFVDPLLDGVHVRHVAQHHHRRVIDPGQGRPQRLGPRAQHQLVVGKLVPAAARHFARVHDLADPVNRHRLVAGAHIEVERRLQRGGRLQQQLLPVRDHAPDVVRQPAVRERHVRTALQHHDLRLFIQAAQARRRRHTRGHAAYHYDLHRLFSYLLLASRAPISPQIDMATHGLAVSGHAPVLHPTKRYIA
jgi:hypothetical protein